MDEQMKMNDIQRFEADEDPEAGMVYVKDHRSGEVALVMTSAQAQRLMQELSAFF